jgi:hypothetical protein
MARPKNEKAREEYYRTRVVVESATLTDYNRNPKRFKMLMHRSELARYVITPGETIVLPNGQVQHKQGLTLEFARHKFVLDVEDPDFDLIWERLHDSGDWKLRLFCANEIVEEGGEVPSLTEVGVNQRTKLERAGVGSEAQLGNILRAAGLEADSGKQVKKMQAKIDEQNKAIEALEKKLVKSANE